MKCPVCGRESRAGTLRCRKCEVMLVESAHPATKPATASSPTPAAKQNQRAPLLLWSGQDPVLFSAVTHALSAAAIPFYESAVHDPAVGLFASFPLRSEAVGGFEVRVAGCDLEAAREILASIVATIGTIDSSDAGEDGLENKSALASRATDDWQADEDTAELWNGDDEAWAGYLIDVLWENGVRARADLDPGAQIQRVLVRPSDFVRAQQVVRLLDEASAPD